MNHQKRILDLQGFWPFDNQAEAQVATEIAAMAREHLKPRLIFGRCIDFLIEKRIQVPGVGRLTDLIRTVVNRHKADLVRTVDMHMTPEVRQVLDDLFMQEEGANRYKLTLLKKISQSMRPRKITATATDFETVSDLYQQITPLLEAIHIGPGGIRYYAGSVSRSRIFQLKQRTTSDRHLHAIAFTAHQHHRLQDALVDMLLSAMTSFENVVQQEHKDQVLRSGKMLTSVSKPCWNPSTRTPSAPCEKSAFWSTTKRCPRPQNWTVSEPFSDHDHEGTMDLLQKDIRQGSTDDVQYRKILEFRSRRLQNRVNPILRQVTFTGDNRRADLPVVLAYFREKGGELGPDMPLGFLTPDERDAVSNESNGFRASLCKVYLFQHVAGAVKAGNLNLNGSYKYRPLDDYLISRDRWNKEKRNFSPAPGCPDLPTRSLFSKH